MSNHPVTRKGARSMQSVWTEATMDATIHKLQSVPGSTIRGVAKEYRLSECTVRFRLKKINEGKSLEKSRKKCTFDKETESSLAKCISVVCNHGFSPSMNEVQVNASRYKMERPSTERKTWLFLKKGIL